jgi:DNA-binding HxlR family transcriptional regulator
LSQRTYAQLCALATALDIIGDRWALLVVRELMLGPKRFTDLLPGLPGAGTNTVSARLESLEKDGVIIRRWLPPPAASTVYELTDRGRELEPIVLGLSRWGAPAIGTRPIEHPIRANWLGMAMLAFFRPEGVPPAAIGFVLPTGSFVATVARGALRVADGELSGPGIHVRATEDALLASLKDPDSLCAAIDGGAIEVDGDRRAFDAFIRACAVGSG